MPAGVTVRVFLVDDHPVVRTGLREYLQASEDIEVVGEAASVATALECIPDSRPDVALVDLRLPGTDGVELVRTLRAGRPAVACLIFSGTDDARLIAEAIAAGASGFVLKGSHPEELVAAILEVASGGEVLPDRLVKMIVSELRASGRTAPVGNLTPQQRNVLSLLREGLSNREIAHRLGVAEKTVRNQVSLLLARLGMRDRTQAALYAERHLGEDER